MANLLYIDTSGSIATIALSADSRKVAVRTHENAMEQAAVVNILIEEVLAEAGLGLQAIHALVVCAGPGSYTGLRVGMSTAKGICYALDKPLILISKLKLIALDKAGNKNTWVILKARQGEYFAAAFDTSLEWLQEPGHYFEAELTEALAKGRDSVVITDVPDVFAENETIALSPVYAANVDKWIPAAEAAFVAGQFADLAYADPYYLKAAFTTQSKK